MSHYPQTGAQAAAYESMLFKSCAILTLSGAVIALCVAYFLNPAIATPGFLLGLRVLGFCLFWFVSWTLFDVIRGAK